MDTLSFPIAEVTQIAPIHRFSTSDYLEMIDKGVLGPDDHVELIEGIIVEMAPAGIPHNHFTMRVTELFAPLLGRFRISVQGTLTVAEGQVFDPDFMLLQPRSYKTRLPEAADVVLLIEAAESSLSRDQKIKLPIYANAGISEYWIVDLERELLLVHRAPQAKMYGTVERRQGEDIVSPIAAPDLSFAVRQFFE
jgi:Uma2 family endonuclease